jgi:hypothetical protein
MMKKKIKNKNRIHKDKDLSKYVKSDGLFKINEAILLEVDKIPQYNYNYMFLFTPFIESKIDNIMKINDTEYKYLVSISHERFKYHINESYKIWVDATLINKLDNGDGIIHTTKYTKGQKVGVFTWWGEFNEDAEIINVYRSIDTKQCNYEVQTKNLSIFIVPEEKILTGKRNVLDSEFKPGDKVIRKYNFLTMIIDPILLNLTEEKIIKEVITFDQTQNINYLKFDDLVLHDSNLYVKCKEPLIIYSEVDPFGEEDWNY